MYEIFAGNTLVYSDLTPAKEVKVTDPKLSLEDCGAGSLMFTLPPTNAFYNQITPLLTELTVKEEGEEIWRGRVISDSLDFWKCKRIIAEGELAYLIDSIQPPKKYNVSNTTIRLFLVALITEHNRQNGETNYPPRWQNWQGYNKIFEVGQVTVDDGDSVDDDDAINRFTNYETTLECINTKLVERLGGHIRIRKARETRNGVAVTVRYIDYLKDFIHGSNQEIRFGRNLLDFARDRDATELVTAVIPRGARLDEEKIEGLEAYTTAEGSTIVDSWHTRNSMVVINPAAVSTYGFICAVVDWSNVTDPDNLVKKAKKYLTTSQYAKIVLQVSAVDLHYLNPEIDALKMLDMVRCISQPHGMDAQFPVTKVDIDLVNPANTQYTLGTEVYASLTSANNKMSSDIYSYIEDTHIPVESVILNSAKANAKALIEGTADDGYAGFIYGTDSNGDARNVPTNPNYGHNDRTTGLRVANAKEDSSATHRWLFTYGGLMHQNKKSGSWQIPNVAITMDGKMVADFITVGEIKLTGASTAGAGSDKAVHMVVYNGSTKIGHWGSDGIQILKGSIRLGTKDSSNRWPFYVDNDGNFQLTTWTDDSKTTVRNRWTSSSIYISTGSIRLGTKDSSNRWPFYVDNDGNFQLTTWTDNSKTTVRNRWTSSSIYISNGEIALGNYDGGTGIHATSGGTLKIRGGSLEIGNPDSGTGIKATDDGTLKIRGGSLEIGNPDSGTGIKATDDGTLKIRGGSITIKKDDTKNFYVNTEGYMFANYGMIGGFNIGNGSIGDPMGKTNAVGMVSGTEVYAWHPSNFIKMRANGLILANASIRVYNSVNEGQPVAPYIQITSGAVQDNNGNFAPLLSNSQYNKLMDLLNS
jgi:hypothetical protein